MAAACLPVLSLPSPSEGLPAPGGPNGTQAPCPEYSCPHGLCIGFQLVRVGGEGCGRQSHRATQRGESSDPRLPRCAMGILTVTRRARQAPPRKSRAAGPGDPGARGSPAAGRAGPGCRPAAAAALRPGSRCCSSAPAPSARPRPASRPPAQVRGLGTGEGSAPGGAGRTGAREAAGPPPPAHGTPASQWTANGPPGRPGPRALSRARAP